VSGRPRSALSVLAAICWPVTHGGRMIAERRTSQALRARADRDVLRDDLVAPLSLSDGLQMLRDHLRAWSGP
jgi:hypothetical protein